MGVRENEVVVQKKFIPKLLNMLAGLVVAVVGTFAVASPAQAATGPGICYNSGAYSFKYVQSSAHYYYYIDAWGRTGCPGTSLVRGEVYWSESGHVNQWAITAYDIACDAYGFTLYTNNGSVASTGCGTSPTKYISLSALNGKNKDFWINWHGVNSQAHPLP